MAWVQRFLCAIGVHGKSDRVGSTYMDMEGYHRRYKCTHCGSDYVVDIQNG